MPAALPLILELHDIRKDDPLTPKLKPSDSIPHLGATSIKIKKHKKGKKKAVPGAKSNTSVSTASLSDTSSIAPSATDVVEEFYDAHESYHAIPGLIFLFYHIIGLGYVVVSKTLSSEISGELYAQPQQKINTYAYMLIYLIKLLVEEWYKGRLNVYERGQSKASKNPYRKIAYEYVCMNVS